MSSEKELIDGLSDIMVKGIDTKNKIIYLPAGAGPEDVNNAWKLKNIWDWRVKIYHVNTMRFTMNNIKFTLTGEWWHEL